MDALLAADERRRAAVSAADGLRAEQKALGRRIPKASPEERRALLEQAKKLAEEVKAAEADQAAADAALREARLAICESDEDVVNEVAITVVHEIAHHFGIQEERLHELGWG